MDVKEKKNRRLSYLWPVIFWLLLWHIVSIIIDSKLILVSPLTVVGHLFVFIKEAEFWSTVLSSFVKIIGGFLLALLTGSMWAALSAKYKGIKQLLWPVILAIKTVPVASFIILALFWFSSQNLSVFISFLMVFPIIYTNVLKGIEETDEKLVEMAEVFQISSINKIRSLYIPQIMPYFRAGCSISLGLCWKSGIAAEVIGMPAGSMGERLQQAKVYWETADVLAWTVVIVIISLVFELLFLKILDKITAWWERM
ncbi:MAG: ABC transporter permease subunit [Lachnospiraceae bacterium]|nr:ABC transporter permease subunit [Lachnospiraceae bacterium]